MFVMSTFSLKLPLNEVKKKTVVFRVFDWDKFTESDEIGEVCNNLPSLCVRNMAGVLKPLSRNKTVCFSYHLRTAPKNCTHGTL